MLPSLWPAGCAPKLPAIAADDVSSQAVDQLRLAVEHTVSQWVAGGRAQLRHILGKVLSGGSGGKGGRVGQHLVTGQEMNENEKTSLGAAAAVKKGGTHGREVTAYFWV